MTNLGILGIGRSKRNGRLHGTSTLRLIALAVGSLWLSITSVQSQSVTATLVGTVLDQSGAAVPEASLSLTNIGTNITRTVQTNERGDYTIPSLPPGFYHLIAEHEGFKRTVVDQIELLVNQTARVDVVLQVGAVAESVEVTGTAPVVASETSSVGQVIDTNQIGNLPLKGRAVFELALLSPAVSPPSPSSYQARVRPMPGGLGSPVFSAGGGRDNNNGYLIDGAEAVDPHYMTPSMFPPMDSMQEFKLQTNSYSAEFGRFSVQVNATTKGGTNQLHGSLHHFFRNDALDAANFFDNFTGQDKAPLRYNLFGGTLGGPIVRNRTFYFVAYEGTRIRRNKTAQLNVPTPEQRNGDFSELGFRNNQPIFDPATTQANPSGVGVVRDPFLNNIVPPGRITSFAKTILDFYPQPGVAVATGNNFFTSLSDTSDNNQLVTRVDHRLSDNTSLSFRYNLFDGIELDKSPIENGGVSTDVRNHNMVFSTIHTFSPNTLYELRLGYNRPNYARLQEGAFETNYAPILGIKNLLDDPIVWGIPSVSLARFSGMGLTGNPNAQLSNIYQLITQVSLIRGAHNLKMGFEGRKTNYNDRGERNVRGAYSFTGAMSADPQNRGGTGVSVADLLLGLPEDALGSGTSLAGNFNAFHYFGFIQDDWKIGPRVTVNLGLRYEINTRFIEVQNRQSFFDRTYPGGRLLLAGTNTAFVPVNDIIEAPFTPRGLFDADKNNWGPRVGLAFRPFGDNRTAIRMGYGIFYTMVDGQATRQLERNPPRASVVDLAANIDAHSNAPDALRVSELFPAQGTADARPRVWTDIGFRPEPYIQQWNLSIQRQVPGNNLVELGYIGSKGTRTVYYSQGNQATFDPDPSNPTSRLSRQPFPAWGNNLRTTMSDGNSSYHAGFLKVERRFSQGVSYLAHYTFGKSLDVGSEINNPIRDFGNPKDSKGRSEYDIRHRMVFSTVWELPVGNGKRYLNDAGIASKVLGDWQLNSIVQLRSGFPFNVGTSGGDVCNCNANSQRAQQVGDPWSGFTQSRLQWFNTAAFLNPARGTFGNSGRNILDGPGEATVSFSVFRNVRLKERARLQIRGEFFNLFNRVNFGFPGRSPGSPTYGVITSAGDARIVQLALRLVF